MTVSNTLTNKVVVAEDDADTRANLCDILEMEGYDVRAVGTCAEAVRAAADDHAIAVVLDRQMPDGLAEDWLDRFKGACPEAAVIVVTGYPGIDSAIACLRHGAEDYLLKPANPDALLASVRRVVRQRESKQLVREQKHRIRAILDTATDAIINIDRAGIIVELNAATERIFGYARSELLGKNIKVLMPSPYRQEHDGYIADFLRTGDPKIIGIGREVRGRRKDGSIFPMDLAVSEIREFGLFTGIVRDISHRKELERRLAESRDEERRRIAQELHDGVGGHLTGIGLLAKALQMKLQREKSPHAEEVRELVEDIRAAHEQVRRVSRGLLPVEPDPGGLQRALARLAGELAGDNGVDCRVVCESPVMIHDPQVAHQAYRIAQEAVSNAVRHGKPSAVTIKLAAQSGQVTMEVHDDGVGIDAGARRKAGMGLLTMMHRADAIGGALRVYRAGDEGGTIVSCTFSNGADSP